MSKAENIIKNYTSADAANLLVETFHNELVSSEDQKLLELAFAKKIEQSRLDDFLKNWDIEKFGERKSLMLSYVMKANPELQFSIYEKPRLEVLLKFHRFRNLKLISHYTKIVRALNQENIFPMILKGGAMKHIRPDLSRAMADIDILIADETEFMKAREICKNLGYLARIPDERRYHSVDLYLPGSEEGVVDLHRYILFENFETNYDKKFLRDLFARSNKEKVFTTQSFVPSVEDLLFLGMANLARNLKDKSSFEGILYSLFDFKYLIESKSDFNWNLVLQNIIATNTQAQVFLAMKFANRIIPGFLPESLLEGGTNHKKLINHCNRMIFHQSFFNSFRQDCKNLNFKDALKNMVQMKNYLVKKPRYFFIKRIIRKSDVLIGIFLTLTAKKQEI